VKHVCDKEKAGYPRITRYQSMYYSDASPKSCYEQANLRSEERGGKRRRPVPAMRHHAATHRTADARATDVWVGRWAGGALGAAARLLVGRGLVITAARGQAVGHFLQVERSPRRNCLPRHSPHQHPCLLS